MTGLTVLHEIHVDLMNKRKAIIASLPFDEERWRKGHVLCMAMDAVHAAHTALYKRRCIRINYWTLFK